MISKLGLGRLSVSVFGRNLFYFYKALKTTMRSRPSEHPGPTRLPWEVLPQLPAVSVFHFVQVSDKTTIQKQKEYEKDKDIISCFIGSIPPDNIRLYGL